MDLPKGQSAFLWGARKTGKSTYLHSHFTKAQYYDLLKTDEFNRLLTKPHLLREELLALSKAQRQHPIIIDEIQKIPLLLNEVHWLIENENLSFILCGSSARKLKRGAANLLGGRAWRFNFFPLVYHEIKNFDLLRAINHGLLPAHYLTTNPKRFLRAYVNDYLAEEIQAEGIVRNLPGFARFLDSVGFSHCEMLNYRKIASDCAIDAKTVKEYYQIFVDTLIAYLIYPYRKKVTRDVIQTTPKFYLFDVGIANYLARKTIKELKSLDAGKSFEHFIFMEIIAYQGLHELDHPIHYWRSKSGLEVDFILNHGQTAIEVKLSESPRLADLKGLSVFSKDYMPKYAIVVCQAPRKRLITIDSKNSILVLPWREFLTELWQGSFHN